MMTGTANRFVCEVVKRSITVWMAITIHCSLMLVSIRLIQQAIDAALRFSSVAIVNSHNTVLPGSYYNAYILIVERATAKQNGMIHYFHGSLRSLLFVLRSTYRRSDNCARYRAQRASLIDIAPLDHAPFTAATALYWFAPAP